MVQQEVNLNTWLSADEACELLGIKFDTLRKQCAKDKYLYKTVKKGKQKEYKILLSSLPDEARAKHKADSIDLNEGLMAYNKADGKSRKLADKYIEIINSCKHLKGEALKEFIESWNFHNPDNRTSYSRVMEMRKKFELYGLAGLITSPHGNTGKSKLKTVWSEYFKQLYLVEGAPTAESCQRIVKGCFAGESDDFPSARTFLRKLQREVPRQSIYLARYGYAKWNKKYANYIERDYSNVRAGECWVSDHAQIDVMVMAPNGEIKAPWVTAWRDFKTNKWLGWLLHLEPGNADHIFQTFYYAGIDYTKYKLHDGEKNYFSNSDIFQMVTYENIHNTEFAILLYPQDTAEKFAWKHKINSKKENYIISTCVDLSYDLSSSQEAIKILCLLYLRFFFLV